MTTPSFPFIAVATITESIGPLDRSAKYADPLDSTLRSAGLGMVTGGGSQMDASRQIAFVDIEVSLADLEGSIDLLRTTLQRLGAPSGSVLSFERNGTIAVISVATGEASPMPDAGAKAMQRRLLDPASHVVPTYDQNDVLRTAERLLASYRSLFIDSYPLGPIDPDAYQRDVFVWYDTTGAELATLGFTPLGDLKIVKEHGKREPGAGPFARRFLSSDHAHRMDIFQIKSPKTQDWVRVVNMVTELSDGCFLWTTTAEKHWNTPAHVIGENLPAGTPVRDLLAAHQARLAAYTAEHPGSQVVELTSLESVLDSENRCQALTAAFRRAQGVPTIDELLRLGSERTLATLAHAEMRRLAFGDIATATGAWHVTTVDLPHASSGPMGLRDLIDFSLEQGIRQVEAAGSPLHPFLIEGNGRAHFFMRESGDADPMEIALQTLRTAAHGATTCALVIDARITLTGGKKTDAILVIASERGVPEGEMWAQAYRPKGFLRSFKRLPMRERVGSSRNLFDEAVAVPANAP